MVVVVVSTGGKHELGAWPFKLKSQTIVCIKQYAHKFHGVLSNMNIVTENYWLIYAALALALAATKS